MSVIYYAFLAFQVLTFAAFTWAAVAFFKVTPQERNNPKIQAIRWLGLVFVIVDLYCSYRLIGQPSAISLAIGTFIFAVTFILFVSAIHVNRVERLNFAFTAGEPSSLVKAGPYQYIRHPFYLSYFLAWLAVPVALLNAWLAIPILVMGWLYVTAATAEEKRFLSNKNFATEYQQYRERTGMFLPKLRGGR